MSENVIFIRHILDKKDETESMYNQYKIAYNNDGKPWNTTNKDYIGYKIFDKLLKEPEKYLLIAEYENKILVGKIEKKSKVGYEYGKYKTLQFSKESIKKYYPSEDFPVYQAVRPQKSTCCEPHTAFMTKVLPFIYKHEDNQKIQATTELLHAKVIEQMCEEYLRQKGYDETDEKSKLDYSSCRVGKTMKDFDIVGRAKNGRTVLAQVKSDNVSKYLGLYENIKKEDNKVYIVFADGENNQKPIFKNKELNIQFIPIKSIYKYFVRNNRQMIIDMIGLSEKYKELIKFDED